VLRDADLKGAEFLEADLTGADFSGADVTGADFSGAIVNHLRYDERTRGITSVSNTLNSTSEPIYNEARTAKVVR
jgi:uncharacterized protein YjbI with pentapeptide repeats